MLGNHFWFLVILEFIPSFYHFMCDFNKIGVCVCVCVCAKWENKVQHVKNKYNGFWFKVK